MAFCGKCGSEVAEGAAFCPKCGAALGVATAAPMGATVAGPVAVSGVSSGLHENIAATLSYVLGWVTGIVFLLIDKRPFVRFHAAQSIVVFGALFIIRVVLGLGFLGSGSYGMFGLWSLISFAISVLALVLWVVLMVKAYQGKRFEVPGAAGIAKNIAGNTPVV
jgi:uncharacterized membrane protein